MKIKLNEYVSSASSNEAGLTLFTLVDRHLVNNEQVEISFEGVTIITSSFLNSFLGELFDKHGIDHVRKSIKFKSVEIVCSNTIKKYITDYKEHYSV
ncbi:MAG: STAS-like domain-containing protein [Bacteroidetes bacterium]|nr:STAS-like domain-containing protein [Bacteroidota bacterium]